MTETEVLFQELDALFFNSWARPGVDLQPEIWQLGTKVSEGFFMFFFSTFVCLFRVLLIDSCVLK